MALAYILTVLILSPDLSAYTVLRQVFLGLDGRSACQSIANIANRSGMTASCRPALPGEN